MKIKSLKYFFCFLLSFYSLNDISTYGQEFNAFKPFNTKKINLINSKLLKHDYTNKTNFYLGLGIFKTFSLTSSLKNGIAFLLSPNIFFNISNHFNINTGVDLYSPAFSKKIVIGLNLIPSISVYDENIRLSFGAGGNASFTENGAALNIIISIKNEYFFKRKFAFGFEIKNLVNYKDYLTLFITTGIAVIL